MNYFQILLIFSAITTGCTLTSTSKSSQYKEDLSAYRMDYSMVEEIDTSKTTTIIDTLVYDFEAEDEITADLHTLIDSISTLNMEDGYVNGYTIQIYTGRDREEASTMKNKVYRVLPDSRPKLIFDAPNFEVKVGQYSTKFEAHSDFVELKKNFPTTIIIPERIKINN